MQLSGHNTCLGLLPIAPRYVRKWVSKPRTPMKVIGNTETLAPTLNKQHINKALIMRRKKQRNVEEEERDN